MEAVILKEESAEGRQGYGDYIGLTFCTPSTNLTVKRNVSDYVGTAKDRKGESRDQT